MEEIFVEELLKHVLTKEDLVLLLDDIDLAGELSFKTGGVPLSEKIKGRISASFQNYLEFLEKKGIITQNSEKNHRFFEDLKNYFLKLPQINIEIAFLPKQEFIEKVSFWLEKNFGEKVILNFIFNPNIGGGAKIEYKGRYFDFSIAKKLNELLPKNPL